MPPLLKSSERTLLRRAFEVLSRPLAEKSLADWRGSVLTSLIPLFKADSGAFILPLAGNTPATIAGRPESYLVDYGAHLHLDFTARRLVELGGVASSANLFNGNRRILTGSDIYNVVFAPYDVEDAMLCTTQVTERPIGALAGYDFAPNGVPLEALLALWAPTANYSAFDEHGLQLMDLLRPALQAGTQTWVDYGHRAQSMLRMIDAATDGLALFDRSGTLTHRNPALSHYLASDPEAAKVEVELARLAHTFTGFRLRPEDRIPPRFELTFVTAAGHYTLRATEGEPLLGATAAVIIQVHRIARKPFDETDLMRRFGLTQREAEVTVMLAQGASNKAIAARIMTTEHTARRHTENILRKLGLNSRAQVANRLLASEP